MNIAEALKLTPGTKVLNNNKVGRVKTITNQVHKNVRGEEYIWIAVSYSNYDSVWASNRLKRAM